MLSIRLEFNQIKHLSIANELFATVDKLGFQREPEDGLLAYQWKPMRVQRKGVHQY